MRQLIDILIEKKRELGSYAKIARALGGVSGQQLGQYATGKIVPSFDIAVRWKQAFGENIIDLMFAEEAPAQVAEPEQPYGKYTQVLEDLNECNKENKKLQAEIERLKNFGQHVGSK